MENPFATSYYRALRGTWTHPDPAHVLDEVTAEQAGTLFPGLPNTIYQITKHMLSWGWWSVKTLQGEIYEIPETGNFFPTETAPESHKAWADIQREVGELIVALENLVDLIDPAESRPEWRKMTAADILMFAANHNAYHSAHVVMMRRLMGNWG